jgi:hypothetical protein
LVALVFLLHAGGCATIRTTDTARTATEQFLVNTATMRSVEKLSLESLRDRVVYIDATYLSGSAAPSQDQSFLLGELRSRMLAVGARLVDEKSKSEIVMEVRAVALGVDRYEYLLGLPSVPLSALSGGSTSAAQTVLTPELSIVKWTRQQGYSSVAITAFWRDTGDVVALSGPALGRTNRQDYWFFGIGPRTVGNIPSAER